VKVREDICEGEEDELGFSEQRKEAEAARADAEGRASDAQGVHLPQHLPGGPCLLALF